MEKRLAKPPETTPTLHEQRVDGRDCHFRDCSGHAGRVSIRAAPSAGWDCHLRGSPGRTRMEFAFAWLLWPRRSRFRPGGAPGPDGIALCVENRPASYGIVICVAAPATQFAIPSGQDRRPDGIVTCVGLSPRTGWDSPLRGSPTHAGRVSVRTAPVAGRDCALRVQRGQRGGPTATHQKSRTRRSGFPLIRE